MAYENIRTEHRNFVKLGYYYYTMNHIGDVLLQKTSDGSVAFSYPLNIDLAYEITHLVYDGQYFWSMDRAAATGNTTLTIRKWEISNFILTVKQTITLNTTNYPGDNFQATYFAVEHYHKKISGTASAGATTITLNNVSNLLAGEAGRLLY